MPQIYFRLNGSECPNPSSIYGAAPDNFVNLWYWNKVNSVELSRGRKPNEAHLIITKSMRDSLLSSNTIQMVHDSGTVTMPYWYVSKCEAITSAGDNNQLFYLEMKDPRHLGEMKTINATPSGILNTHRLVTGTQPPAVTWQTVLNSLWAELPTAAKGTSLTCPTLAGSPSSSAENLTFEGITAWRAIHQTLTACGHVAVFNQVTGAYSFVQHNTTQSGLSASQSAASALILWSGDIPSTNQLYPEKVGVIFPPFKPGSEDKIIWYGTASNKEVATGISGAIAGTRIDIVDTTRVEKDSGGSITNQTQMDNRLTDISKSIRGICNAISSRLVTRYYSYVDISPGSQISVVRHESLRNHNGTTTILNEELSFDTPSAYPCLPVKAGSGSGVRRISGTVQSMPSGTDECDPTFVAENIVGIGSAYTETATPTIHNTVGAPICTGMKFRAEYNELESRWEVYYMQPPRSVVDVYLDGLSLKQKKSGCFNSIACADTETVYTGTECP